MYNLNISTILNKYMALLVMLILTNAALGQYTISGPSCVLPGSYPYAPHTISGDLGNNAGANDVWKITNGTINGNTTYINPGNPNCAAITWNLGATTGTVAYYRPATATTPVATYTVNIIDPGTIDPNYTVVPTGLPVTIQLTGTAIYPCSAENLRYQWQKQVNGIYADIPGATSKDYTISSEVFTQQTNFWRKVILNGQAAYNRNSPAVINPRVPPVPGVIYPPNLTVLNTQTVPITISTSPATGGPYPGNYNYYWQSSIDNINWYDVYPTASGLGYTITQTPQQATYYRQRITTGDFLIGVYSGVATLSVLGPLDGGSIYPPLQKINYNTTPAYIQATTGIRGTCLSTYNYEWQSSLDGIIFTAIPGAPNSIGYNPGNLTATTYFRRKTTLVCTSTEEAYSNIVVVYVSNPTDNANYIRERMFNKGGLTNEAELQYLSNTREVRQSTTYFDGLGRNIQTVLQKGSCVTNSNNPGSAASATDMVSIKEYDELGREPKQYLPYVSTSTNGLFKPNPIAEQNNFYTGTTSPLMGQQENYFYSKTNFEASPLKRVEKAMPPGINWTGSDRGAEMKYWSNTLTDDIKIWNVTTVANAPFATYSIGPIPYAAGTLFKNSTKDEKGNQVIEFKDKEGKVILKKVQLTATADDGNGSGYNGWLCTYYIYDDFNNLRCVIQPRGVELLVSSTLNWDINIAAGALLDEQCFRYEYDGRNRMIIKKVPGAGAVYMIYDARDRLVMTQDANLRNQKQWMVMLYDELNRPVATGLITDNNNTYSGFQQHLSAAATNSNDYPNSYPNVVLYPFDLLTRTGYDNYTGLPNNALHAGYDAAYATYAYGINTGSFPYPEPITPSTATKGMVTWTQTKVLGLPGSFIYSVNIYDDKGRLIQVKTKNATGGTDVSTTQYSFNNLPLVTIQKQEKGTALPQPGQHLLVTKMEYDDLWRLITVKKSVNIITNNASYLKLDKVIVKNEYNALGQLKKKSLGENPNVSGTPLAKQDFDYNIRGWLLSINKDYITNSTNNNEYFGMQLGYDKNSTIGLFTNPQYNGNISGTVWKSEGDQEKRKYDFTYDAVNRLTGGDFNQYTSGSGTAAIFDKSAQIDFSEGNISYDANGNILTLARNGLKLGSSTLIDNLTYNYKNYQGINYSNQLLKVTDAVNAADNGKLGDFKDEIPATSTDDYSYDDNGNMKADNNKAISNITYNHLNLPAVITTGKGTISYVYDATGNKLAKIVAETNKPAKTTLYLGNAVYEDNVLQFISHEEGRIRFNQRIAANPTIDFDYFIKDHLGNIRVVLTEEQQQNAYPAATMETAAANTEEALYSGLNTTRYNKNNIAGYPTDNSTGPNDQVALLNGSSNKIGPGITLKVMAGDKFNIKVSSWYRSNGSSPGNPANPIPELLAAIASGVGGAAGQHGGITPSQLESSGILTPGVTQFLNTQTPDAAKPKAYLNWVLLDEQFKFVSSSSGAEQVGGNEEFKQHIKTNLPVDKNGYLYIYVSNETPDIDVFFDNLQVTHTRGPILEENHYYPFGLLMQGISSRAAGSLENKRKWNAGSELESKEFSDGSGLELYSTQYRSLDPQLGRFWQIDPRPDYTQSLYSSMNNNPISFIDPLGDSILGKRNNAVADKIVNTSNNKIAANDTKIASNNTTIKNASDKLASGKLSEKETKAVNKTIANLTKSNTELNGRNENLRIGIAAITAMRADAKNNYSFESPASDDGTHHVTQGTGKNVIVEGSNTGLFLHESIHILQGLNSGGLRFSPNPNTIGLLLNIGATGSRIGDEVQSYQVQFSFDGTFSTSGARNLSDINSATVRDLHDSDNYPYRNL